MILQGNMTSKNHYNSTNTVPTSPNFVRMITCVNGLLPIKSHESLIPWFCEITWQTKTIISPIAQSICPPNLVGDWLNLSSSQAWGWSSLWSRGNDRSYDKLKPLYFHSVYDQQTWQGGGITSRAPIVIVTWPLNSVILFHHVTN